ncbi:hypothetical protein L915_17949, partial [Phytophthora nicotianae]
VVHPVGLTPAREIELSTDGYPDLGRSSALDRKRATRVSGQKRRSLEVAAQKSSSSHSFSGSLMSVMLSSPTLSSRCMV